MMPVLVTAAAMAASSVVWAGHGGSLERCDVPAIQENPWDTCDEGTVLVKEHGFCQCKVDPPLPAGEFDALAAYTGAKDWRPDGRMVGDRVVMRDGRRFLLKGGTVWEKGVVGLPTWGEVIAGNFAGSCPGAADFIDSHIVDGEVERLFFDKRITVEAEQQRSGCWGMVVVYHQPTLMESRWSGPQ